MSNRLPPGRALPTKVTKVIALDFLSDLTLWDRVKVACGYNLELKIRIGCQHSPGTIKPVAEIKPTKMLNGKAKGLKSETL